MPRIPAASRGVSSRGLFMVNHCVPANLTHVAAHSQFTSKNPKTGVIGTAPGVTTFDPTKDDNSCLAAPNNNPLKLFQHTPMFDNYDISVGGNDLGHTQYIDAFQRAEFWNVIHDRDNEFESDDYHLILDPVHTLSPFVLTPAVGHHSSSLRFSGLRPVWNRQY